MDEFSEKEISGVGRYRHILENFLETYLTRRDAEKTLSLVTEDIYSLGTGVQEVAHNKVEFRQLLYHEMEQLTTPITYQLDTYQEKTVVPGVCCCICDVTTCIQLEGQPAIHYTTRLTAGFREENGVFLAYHLHMSEASAVQQEYEFFPLHYGALESSGIDTDKQIELVDIMKKMLPGGAMGGYVEPGFPLYFVNDELLNWLGYTYDEFIAENGQMMSNTMHPDDVAAVEAAISEAFGAGNEYAVEYRMRKKDKSYIWVRDIGRKVITPGGREAMISVIADISSERLRQQSFERTIESMKKERRKTDRMTGLLNREPAEILMEQHLIREHTGAFFLMDIDNFKLVNDTKGHPAGDQVLHTFAGRLKEIFPPETLLARLGGDEFIAFLPGYENRRQLQSLAKRVLKESEQLISDVSLAQKLGVSVGIAIAPEHGTEMKELYANADKGLYYAKRNGKNRYSFFRQAADFPDTGEKEPTIHTLCRMIQMVLDDQGVFKVEYDTFNKICQFALRNARRLQYATQLVLFSLHADGAEMTEEEQLSKSKNILEEAINGGLRMGDLMMDFSANQIAVLLVNCSEQNAALVAERILVSYGEAGGRFPAPLTYECRSIKEDMDD